MMIITGFSFFPNKGIERTVVRFGFSPSEEVTFIKDPVCSYVGGGPKDVSAQIDIIMSSYTATVANLVPTVRGNTVRIELRTFEGDCGTLSGNLLGEGFPIESGILS